jgi:HB1, ASXL, restriction endonuclease HTH domain
MNQQQQLELLAEVRRDIANAEQALADLRRLEAYLEGKAAMSNNNSQTNTATPPPAPLNPPKSQDLMAMTQSAAIEAVLREIKRPMRTMEILDRMVARGFAKPEKHKTQSMANSLFSVMRRKTDCFCKMGKGLWGLTEWKTQETAGQNGVPPVPAGGSDV